MGYSCSVVFVSSSGATDRGSRMSFDGIWWCESVASCLLMSYICSVVFVSSSRATDRGSRMSFDGICWCKLVASCRFGYLLDVLQLSVTLHSLPVMV